MTSKPHLIALSLVATVIGFSPRPSFAAPAAPAPYVTIASPNSSTPATYNVPTNTVATLISGLGSINLTITVNGVSSSLSNYSIQENNLPVVTGPATIAFTSVYTNGALATIAVTPVTKTTTEPLPR